MSYWRMRGARHPRHTTAVAVALLLVVCSGLAACGGSSSSNTSTNSAAKSPATPGAAAASTTGAGAAGTGTTGTTSATGTTGATGTSTAGATTSGTSTSPGAGTAGSAAAVAGRPFAARFAAVRACLSRNGITLPTHRPGAGSAKGEATLPKGMTRTQYQEVLKKCGGSLAGPGAFRGGHLRANPAFQQALVKFAACMRQDGVNLPTPNTSGKGPVFNGKGINTASPQFRQAEIKCRPVMVAALRSLRKPGGAPPAG